MKPLVIKALNAATVLRQPAAYAKNLTSGAEFVLPDAGAPAAVTHAALTALAEDKTGTHSINGEAWFIEARNPAPRLIVIGAVHIAQALAPLAVMMGFEVILVDPRRAFGNADRFENIAVSNEWPDAALDRLQPDRGTAIVALSHDPKLDDPALDRALRSEAFYIAALGSRKTHAARLQRLAALGHDPDLLNRIRGPAGLSIGAVTAPEIALSVMSEIVARRRNGGEYQQKLLAF